MRDDRLSNLTLDEASSRAMSEIALSLAKLVREVVSRKVGDHERVNQIIAVTIMRSAMRAAFANLPDAIDHDDARVSVLDHWAGVGVAVGFEIYDENDRVRAECCETMMKGFAAGLRGAQAEDPNGETVQ